MEHRPHTVLPEGRCELISTRVTQLPHGQPLPLCQHSCICGDPIATTRLLTRSRPPAACGDSVMPGCRAHSSMASLPLRPQQSPITGSSWTPGRSVLQQEENVLTWKSERAHGPHFTGTRRYWKTLLSCPPPETTMLSLLLKRTHMTWEEWPVYTRAGASSITHG